jgi:hypothetical protein
MLQELSLKSNINKNKTTKQKKESLDLRTFSWSIGAILAQPPTCIKRTLRFQRKSSNIALK